jgi:hypothetical protein
MSKKLVLNSFLAAVLIISLSLIGCSDNTTNPPITPTSNNVTGKVVDQAGTGINGATVSIGSNIATTSSDGSFTINNVTAPYDAKIVLSSGPNPTGLMYKGVNSYTPQFLGTGLPSVPSSAVLKVTIPALGPNQRATVIYTDTGFVHVSQNILPPAVLANLNVVWSSGANITGKILVLVYTFTAGQVSAFDKYGEKTNFVLNNGGTSNVTFTAADLSLNPGETTVSGSIALPPGYMTPNANLLLRFTNKGSVYLGANIGNPVMSNTYSFVVPTGLPSASTIVIGGRGSGPIGEDGLKIITAAAGSSGNVITIETCPNLSTPPNMATNIDTTTNFTWSAGTGSGIYLVNYTTAGKNFYVFTSQQNTTIPSFSSFGLPIGPAVVYSWNVVRISGMTIDQFVSAPLFNNTGFTGTSNSESRTFTSAP